MASFPVTSSKLTPICLPYRDCNSRKCDKKASCRDWSEPTSCGAGLWIQHGCWCHLNTHTHTHTHTQFLFLPLSFSTFAPLHKLIFLFLFFYFLQHWHRATDNHEWSDGRRRATADNCQLFGFDEVGCIAFFLVFFYFFFFEWAGAREGGGECVCICRL